MRKLKWCSPYDLGQIIAHWSGEKNASTAQFDSRSVSMDLWAVMGRDRAGPCWKSLPAKPADALSDPAMILNLRNSPSCLDDGRPDLRSL